MKGVSVKLSENEITGFLFVLTLMPTDRCPIGHGKTISQKLRNRKGCLEPPAEILQPKNPAPKLRQQTLWESLPQPGEGVELDHHKD